MIARLQAAGVLLWLLALAAALAAMARAPWPAAGLLVLLLVGHAGWLALTFALAFWQTQGASAPWSAWGRAWWAEVRAAPAVFAWRQPFQSQAEPDVWPAGAAGRRTGVVLVPGYLCNRAVWNPWLRRLRDEGVPAIALTLEPPFAAVEDHVAALDAAIRQLAERTGRPPLVVGHSMGGLVARAWLRRAAGAVPVAGVVTVGTPHHGTWLARWGHSACVRDMRPGSAWLRQLAADEASRPAERSEGLRLAVFSRCDNIVFPQPPQPWPGANRLEVTGAGHVDLLGRPEVFDAVRRCLG